MSSAQLSQSSIRLTTTPAGFYLGWFKDCKGIDCTVQESNLASLAAIRLGVYPSKGGPPGSPDRMVLTKTHLKLFMGSLEQFAELRRVPEKPITFLDYNNVPCVLATAGENEIFFGVALPLGLDGVSRIQHNVGDYDERSELVRKPIEELFDRLQVGDESRIDVDNRMLLNQVQVKDLLPFIRAFISCAKRSEVKDVV